LQRGRWIWCGKVLTSGVSSTMAEPSRPILAVPPRAVQEGLRVLGGSNCTAQQRTRKGEDRGIRERVWGGHTAQHSKARHKEGGTGVEQKA